MVSSANKTVTINLSEAEKELAERYTKAILYLALVVKDSGGAGVLHSSTFCKTFE
jgi:hypothetical protein